jgi:ubiquinone/menaquinone biosynthesis C-methylase UbiE
MRDELFKRHLVESAGIKPGQDVLDLGCGTGTLTLMLKQSAPRAHVTGLDGDPAILAIARRKADDAGLCVQWDEGMAYALPYLNRSFDVVVSSLVIHHLATDNKRSAFREVHRILRPGGMFRIADFGRPFDALTHLQAAVMRNLEEAEDNFRGMISVLLRDTGFENVQELDPLNTIFGPMWFFSGAKPLRA